jgi:CBS domain-containing protein
MISQQQLDAALGQGLGSRKLSDIMGAVLSHGRPNASEFPHLHSDHDLGLALERMGAARTNVLPVVNRARLNELIGIVTLDDVLRAYGVSAPSAGRRYDPPKC